MSGSLFPELDPARPVTAETAPLFDEPVRTVTVARRDPLPEPPHRVTRTAALYDTELVLPREDAPVYALGFGV